MHELYIAECIVKSVAASLPRDLPSDSVREVRVQVGQLDAVIPDTLIFVFDAIKETSGLPNANLSVEQIDVVCRCRACTHEFGIELPVFICPQCGGGDVEVLRGRGILLTGITVENEEAKEDGNSDHS
jgi:hydrogenase nickel incorporation protein HypA/HybF